MSLLLWLKKHEDFKNSTKCWICRKTYEEGEAKVKLQDIIIEKYQESTHQECNLNLSLSKKIPVVFHNLENYDWHLIFQEIEKHDFKINVIPKTIKNMSSLLLNNLKKVLGWNKEHFFITCKGFSLKQIK